MKAVFALLLGLISLPACAEAPVLAEIENRSAATVTSIAVYPVDAAGNPVEDNLGSSSAPLPPGAIHRQALALIACGKVLVVAGLSDGGERRVGADLCQSPEIVITP